MRQSEPVEFILVIGTGSAGFRHLTNARLLGVRDLAVFSTGDGVRRAPLPASVRLETDLNRALSRGVHAVVIANPTSLHVETSILAANAGCHLLIEKPLSDTLKRVAELQMAVSAGCLTAVIGYQFRFHPSFQQIRHWLQEGAIGEVVSAHAVWREYLPAWQPWRDYRTSYAGKASLGGGVLLTLSHPVDYLRWLLGEIVRVSATTARRSGLKLDVEDSALVHLEFSNGAIASLSIDYIQRRPQHNLTIVGRDGTIHWDSGSGAVVLDATYAKLTTPMPGQFERNHLFIAELNHFFDCIAGQHNPECSVRKEYGVFAPLSPRTRVNDTRIEYHCITVGRGQPLRPTRRWVLLGNDSTHQIDTSRHTFEPPAFARLRWRRCPVGPRQQP